MIPIDGRLIREDEHSFQSKRLLFEIDPVDLRIDFLKKEEMMDTIQPHTPPTNDEDEALDLRTNPFQEGGDDGRGPSTNPLKGHQHVKWSQSLELWSRGSKRTHFTCHKL